MNVFGLAWWRLTGLRPVPSLVRNGRRYLADLYDASREAGVRPFLMWGTLLGCVREQRLLPDDNDLDVGIGVADYLRRDALIAAMAKRGYRLTFHLRYKLRFTHRLHGLFIDVDVFYPWQSRMICSAVGDDGSVAGDFFAAGSFDSLREVDFLDGLKVLIPDPPEPVLKAVYGDWRVPKKRGDYNSATDASNAFTIARGAELPGFADDAGQHSQPDGARD